MVSLISIDSNCQSVQLIAARELCLWAATILSTRSFSSSVLKNAYLEGPNEQDEFPVLVPLIDLLNHRPLAKVEWQPTVDHVGLTVLDDLKPGEEVFNNYGPRSNAERKFGPWFGSLILQS